MDTTTKQEYVQSVTRLVPHVLDLVLVPVNLVMLGGCSRIPYVHQDAPMVNTLHHQEIVNLVTLIVIFVPELNNVECVQKASS